MSAYLIAQLAKNFANKQNEKITGGVLLELALSVIEEIQFMGGGRVVFLETINNEKLINFYKNNCFNNFGSRQSTSINAESHELIQLFKVL